MTISCCRDCNSRRAGCHSTCLSYMAEKAAHERDMEARRREKNGEWDYTGYQRSIADRVAKKGARSW